MYIFMWVNYNISLTWIKAILGIISLTNYDYSEGRDSEVVMKFTQIYEAFSSMQGTASTKLPALFVAIQGTKYAR